jgi:hypothetical protein
MWFGWGDREYRRRQDVDDDVLQILQDWNDGEVRAFILKVGRLGSRRWSVDKQLQKKLRVRDGSSPQGMMAHECAKEVKDERRWSDN